MAAIAALVRDGFGYRPPNGWKCRSGVQMAEKPRWSAYRAALQEQPIPVSARPAAVGSEVEEAEVHFPARVGTGGRAAFLPLHRCARAFRLFLNDHLEAAGQRPEKFEHGDVKRGAGHRQPGSGLLELQQVVDASEKVGHVAVLDQHALGPATGAGGEQDVRQVLGANTADHVRRRLRAGLLPRLEQDHGRVLRREQMRQVAFGEDRGWLGVLEHQPQPFPGIGGVQREIGGAGFQGAQQGRNQVAGPTEADPDKVAGAHPESLQPASNPIGPGVQFRVGEGLRPERHGDGVRCPLHLVLEQFMDAPVPAVRPGGVVPLGQQQLPLGPGNQRQLSQGVFSHACVRSVGPARQVGQRAGLRFGRQRFQDRLHLFQAALDRGVRHPSAVVSEFQQQFGFAVGKEGQRIVGPFEELDVAPCPRSPKFLEGRPDQARGENHNAFKQRHASRQLTPALRVHQRSGFKFAQGQLPAAQFFQPAEDACGRVQAHPEGDRIDQQADDFPAPGNAPRQPRVTPKTTSSRSP